MGLAGKRQSRSHNLCMNIDVIDEKISLPPLERGDRLVISTVGAYNNTAFCVKFGLFSW
ncbi:MAG: hypothetical protein KME60_33710 [Cyanomargarita calcarea GSE-NOS-MK-12-04C]|uniref:Uncharacterized protein n=1 Tax=Cyanomargarita calcarea GSE-NOS-MK-12-04C TaxID=2839659 RepID=A0A951QUC1_9CYAN|nr:hypothetical protein [Cyanomargarita calcarea GSE-NOS-MK-12-04C]